MITLQQQNLIIAVKEEMITWFQFFEAWRQLEEAKTDSWIYATTDQDSKR